MVLFVFRNKTALTIRVVRVEWIASVNLSAGILWSMQIKLSGVLKHRESCKSSARPEAERMSIRPLARGRAPNRWYYTSADGVWVFWSVRKIWIKFWRILKNLSKNSEKFWSNLIFLKHWKFWKFFKFYGLLLKILPLKNLLSLMYFLGFYGGNTWVK